MQELDLVTCTTAKRPYNDGSKSLSTSLKVKTFDDGSINTDVAPCGACRPFIFFINGVFCFLRSDCSIKEREKDDWRCHFKEKMSLKENLSPRKPWIRP
ncbi:hypothetical protein JHK86_010062 [Glycine max]|nr:hypothetical protein JHK86_010062 [Glycine max]